MAFWDRWIGRKASATSSLDILRELIGGYQSKAGVPVNWRTALETSTVLACTRVISEGIAQVPFKLFRQQGRMRNSATDHPVYQLLYRRPNDWQTSFEFREMLSMHLVLTNNAFVFINRGIGETPMELLPFEPGWVAVKRDTFGAPPTYRVTPPSGGSFDVPHENMWHLRGPSWNGWMGLDGVKLAREAIGLAKAAEEFGSAFFANGARPGGLLTTEQALDIEATGRLKKAWEEAHQGSGRAMKMALLGGGLKYVPLSQTPEEAQFIETRRMQVEEVCRTMRVMPIMVGFSDKTATYASAEQMFLAHVIHTLMPWYERIEQSAETNLLLEQERQDGYYAKLMPQGLMRGAHKDRSEYYKNMTLIGAMTQNEVRELEDMNPSDDPEADKLRVQMNTAPTGSTAASGEDPK